MSSQQRFLVSYDVKLTSNCTVRFNANWTSTEQIRRKMDRVMRSAGMHHYQGSLWISDLEPRDEFTMRLSSILTKANMIQQLSHFVIVPINDNPTDLLKVFSENVPIMSVMDMITNYTEGRVE